MHSKCCKAKDTPFDQLETPPVRDPVDMCLPSDIGAGGWGPETGIVYGQTTRTPKTDVWRDWYVELAGKRHSVY